jgi:hypothetical protein
MGNFLLDPTLAFLGAVVDAFLFFAAAALPALVQAVSAVGLCTGWFVMVNSLYGSGPKAVEALVV